MTKKFWLIMVALLCILTVTLLLFYLGEQMEKQQEIAEKQQEMANEEMRAIEFKQRDVYILIDPTKSMGMNSEAHLEKAKKIIKETILPNLSPLDRVYCYKVSSIFNSNKDNVFASPNIVRESKDLFPETANDGSVIKKEMCAKANDIKSICEKRDTKRTELEKQITDVPLQDGGKSDYLHALDYFGTLSSQSQDREKWLFVLGDLEQDPLPNPLEPPPPTQPEKQFFSSVKITLIYPYRTDNAGQSRHPSQAQLQKYWETYFSQRGNSEVEFSMSDGYKGSLPNTPFCGLPKQCEVHP